MCKKLILDTNAYRGLTYGKTISDTIALMHEIRQKEIENNIIVFVSPIVWFELFVHLVNVNDAAFENCLNATIASYLHARLDEQSFDRILANPYTLLAKSLFDYNEPNEQLIGFGKLVGEIYNAPNLNTLTKHKHYLENIKAFVEKKETEFISTFKELANEYDSRFSTLDKDYKRELLTKHLNSEVVFNSVAINEVVKALDTAGMKLSDLTESKLSKNVEFVKENCPAALQLAIGILNKFISNVDVSGFDITKGNRENWVWDFQMLLYISKSSSNILVTDDKPMNDAAKEAGVKEKILKLQDYKILIGI